MEIKTVTEDNLDFICAVCLDPSVDKETRLLMENAMEDRIKWIKEMIPKGLEILVAFDKPREEKIHYKWVGKMLHSDLAIQGKVPMGLLEYIPIEYALESVEGRQSLFINCMWILPPFWNKGIGKALLKTFIQKAKQYGGASVISYDGDKWFGTSINYMPSSFFRKFGFKDIEKDGTRILQHLNLGASINPNLMLPKYNAFKESEKLQLTVFFNNQCPWARYMINTVKKGLKKYKKINLNCINNNNLEVIKKTGVSRGIYLNNKLIINRMASWEEIKADIDKYVKKQH
ncbi:MAG: GNAT family N-acetyltransferase [Promethearchaeota archaeon]